MDKQEVENAITEFMRPTVYTGVEPVLLVAEELATAHRVGEITDAVWVHWEDEDEVVFSYITKFAVEGEITRRSYYDAEEAKPFRNRLALPDKHNLEMTISHRAIQQEIKELKGKRGALADVIHSGLDGFIEAVSEGKEVFVFKTRHGDLNDPFSDIDIDNPYQVIEKADNASNAYHLKHPKSGKIEEHTVDEEFYGYMAGSKADIAGLLLKSESFKRKIEALEADAKEVMKSIEWLDFSDPRIQAIRKKLPRHPFDDYFKYVDKGGERKLQPPKELVEALKIIIAKHMPEYIGPMGVEYIPIDNLLYLFHAIIPRAEALRALEACDIIHEPAGLLLGFEGKRKLPPKFLVSVTHVASAYKKFPAFIEVCERYLAQSNINSE